MDIVFNLMWGALGALLVPLMLFILNKMPEKAFCDYDEEPGEAHRSPRFFMKKQGIALMLFLFAVGFSLSLSYENIIERAALLLFSAILSMISVSDSKYSIIPDELIVAGGVAAIASAIIPAISENTLMCWLSPVIGAAIGAAVIFLLNLVGRLVYHKDALGMGDLKLLSVCGLSLGYKGILVVALLSLFIAGISFAVAMAAKKMNSDEYHPLGPYIVLASVLTLCFKSTFAQIVNWYVSLL